MDVEWLSIVLVILGVLALLAWLPFLLYPLVLTAANGLYNACGPG